MRMQWWKFKLALRLNAKGVLDAHDTQHVSQNYFLRLDESYFALLNKTVFYLVDNLIGNLLSEVCLLEHVHTFFR